MTSQSNPNSSSKFNLMYITTIAKISQYTSIWGGYNMMSQPLLLGDIEKECKSYNTEFIPCEKGEIKILESDWNGYKVMIQYRRI
jgi:hypothetical protein